MTSDMSWMSQNSSRPTQCSVTVLQNQFGSCQGIVSTLIHSSPLMLSCTLVAFHVPTGFHLRDSLRFSQALIFHGPSQVVYLLVLQTSYYA